MQPLQTPPTELPGIELANAIAAWRDEAHYRRFLRRFVERYANIVEVLKGSSSADAAALAHKFRGAAANLWLTDAAAASLSLEAEYHKAGDTSQAMAHFQHVMEYTLASIEIYAPPADLPQMVTAPEQGAINPVTTMKRLLMAWESDCFTEVDSALKAASHLLPAHDFELQQKQLQNYDFRAGEAATRAQLQTTSYRQQER